MYTERDVASAPKLSERGKQPSLDQTEACQNFFCLDSTGAGIQQKRLKRRPKGTHSQDCLAARTRGRTGTSVYRSSLESGAPSLSSKVGDLTLQVLLHHSILQITLQCLQLLMQSCMFCPASAEPRQYRDGQCNLSITSTNLRGICRGREREREPAGLVVPWQHLRHAVRGTTQPCAV